MSDSVRKWQEDLKPKQAVAVVALATGETNTTAAAQAGVTRPTLYEWRQEPKFQRALQAMTRYLEADTYDLAVAGRNLATRRLMAILTTPGAPNVEVIRAAALLLRTPLRSREELKEDPLPTTAKSFAGMAREFIAEAQGAQAALEVAERQDCIPDS